MNKSCVSQMHFKQQSSKTPYITEYSEFPSSTCYQQYVRASNYLFAKITFYELNERAENICCEWLETKSSVCIHRSMAKVLLLSLTRQTTLAILI